MTLRLFYFLMYEWKKSWRTVKTDKVMVINQSKMENGLHLVVTASLGVPTFQKVFSYWADERIEVYLVMSEMRFILSVKN